MDLFLLDHCHNALTFGIQRQMLAEMREVAAMATATATSIKYK